MAKKDTTKVGDINIEIDIELLTLDDLELLSIMSEGTDEDREGIPGFKIIRFLKRIAGDQVGQLNQSEIEPLMVAIAEAVSATQNPEGPQGKN